MNDILNAAGVPAYVQRVVEEHAQLVERISKLDSFMGMLDFERVSIRQQFLMQKQIAAMQEYAWILNERIKDFQK
jgi:hypothetical protein